MEFKKTIELQYDNLKATALCKAKNDVRFYLTGIYIGDGFVAATNGHMALICIEPDTVGMDVIIPGDAIDSLIRKVGNKSKIKTTLLHQIDDEFWCLNHGGNFEMFRLIEGKYPDIKRVDIPKPTEIQFKEFPSFNFTYLGIFQKVAKIYKQGYPFIYPTTERDRAYIEITENVHGILMPCRI
ncbi:hypothetical protein ACG904_17585 [Acinetobacter guillouiae]|uniref:hypothetical protein n=1 Tax=Acinetobacter guillouiae TaxID=106649 RepID=UPI003AF75A36